VGEKQNQIRWVALPQTMASAADPPIFHHGHTQKIQIHT
jgi:hypothetical protein